MEIRAKSPYFLDSPSVPWAEGQRMAPGSPGWVEKGSRGQILPQLSSCSPAGCIALLLCKQGLSPSPWPPACLGLRWEAIVRLPLFCTAQLVC